MSHKEREQQVSRFWEENKVFEKSINQRPKSKQYVFYDGPPFATGLPHYGHILGLTSKDLFPRYWTMKGYRCERRWGWDCHGLPIENIAEKELGIKEKTGIVGMGVKRFNQFCRSKVLFFASEWKKTVNRLGKWIEFDNSYKTMDNSYMETVWWIFKNLYDKGLVYEGMKILLYCPRCETPVAKAEIALDKSYRDVTEKSPIAKFKLLDDDAFILAWTTTPWTLIGNVALAVNPELAYIKVKKDNETLILAKSKIDLLSKPYEIISEFKGKSLVGKQYEPLYFIPHERQAYLVVDGGSSVSAEEGTGVVHLALYGEFDFEMIKKNDLALIQHVNGEGRLVLGPSDWVGDWFKDVDKKVIADLERRGLLFSASDHTHSYPFCYRCETTLLYNAVDSWFINVQKIKSELIKKARLINWYPAHIKEGQFKYILDTAPDWTVSRNRFWATAIPVWKCLHCNKIVVVGSVKELKKKAVEEVPDNLDLHKHVVDEIHLKCKCGKIMSRVPEVIDCWFESGAMPYAAKHYPFENKSWFSTNFPADFVSEYIGQVRAWFYYMHVMGVLLFNKPPFKNVIVTGVMLAEDGSKMSKSKKNFPDPNLIIDKYGADALRFYLMNSQLMRAQDLNFKESNLNEVYRKVVMLLSNIHRFYQLFAGNNSRFNDSSSTNLLDKWVISKLHVLIKSVTKSLDDYDTIVACNLIQEFIDELSTWYVRRSRDRFKSGDSSAIRTLAYVLNNLIRLMAPITPFITEEIHQSFRKSDPKLSLSVHLEAWPKTKPALINKSLNNKMKLVRDIVSMALDEREKTKIPVRQVLSKLKVSAPALSKRLAELIKDELNVKQVVITPSKKLSVKLDTKITDSLLLEGLARELTRRINAYRKELKLTVKNRIVLFFSTSDELVSSAFAKFKKDIMDSVQADDFRLGIPPSVNSKELFINKSRIRLGIKLIA